LTWDKNDHLAIVNRLRRNIIVHSVIYYVFNRNLISDSDYDKMCQKLARIHKKYPKLCSQAVFPKAFKNYDPSTGMNFINHKWGNRAAERLLKSHNK